MVKAMKVRSLILKSTRYIPIIALIVLLTSALVRAMVVHAGGTYNPYEACLA